MSRSNAHARLAGFTLLEVMAAVLVLGLLYTILASNAIQGLRSEGIDRRRAEASLLADRHLAEIEASFDAGVGLPPGLVEIDADPFAVTIEVLPEDVLALLPPALQQEVAARRDPAAASLLAVDRDGGRVQRATVVVAWDEAGDEQRVERTTWGFDRSDLAAFFPADGEAPQTAEEVEAAEAEAEARGDGSLASSLGGDSGGLGGRDRPTRGGGRPGQVGEPPGRPSPSGSAGPNATGMPLCSTLPSPIREFAEANGACR